MYDRIQNIAESLREDITDFTREIVSIPSVTGNEAEVIQRIKKEIEIIGYDEVRIDGMGNLIGRIGSGKKIIAIDGHVDTVETGNLKNWRYDPYKAILKNGIIYGRGACDQKGGVAAAVYAGKVLKEISLNEKLTYLMVASVQEEIYEGLNWQYIIKEEKIKPDFVVLTEPSGLEICIGHRGRIDIKIEACGISSHGAMPERGDNALYKIAPVVMDIKNLHPVLNSEPVFGKGSITVTDIRTTSASINAIPDKAEIHIDRRLNNNDTIDTVLDEIKRMPSIKTYDFKIYIPEYKVKSHTGCTYPIKACYSSWTMDKSHPIVKIAEKTYRDQFKKRPKLRHWDFSTNGVATKGIYDIPTIGFGPADEKYAHTADDQVPVNHLIEAMKFYAAFVKNADNS